MYYDPCSPDIISEMGIVALAISSMSYWDYNNMLFYHLIAALKFHIKVQKQGLNQYCVVVLNIHGYPDFPLYKNNDLLSMRAPAVPSSAMPNAKAIQYNGSMLF